MMTLQDIASYLEENHEVSEDEAVRLAEHIARKLNYSSMYSQIDELLAYIRGGVDGKITAGIGK